MKALCSLLVVMLLGAGCATAPLADNSWRAQRHFAPDGFMTHRAILTARGKQYPINGWLAMSKTGGMRLVVTEHFGTALADVLVKPDGSVHLMSKNSRLKPSWIRKYLAEDLKCLFGPDDMLVQSCPVKVISPDHYVIKRFWYELDLRIVENHPGPQPAGLFEDNSPTPQ